MRRWPSEGIKLSLAKSPSLLKKVSLAVLCLLCVLCYLGASELWSPMDSIGVLKSDFARNPFTLLAVSFRHSRHWAYPPRMLILEPESMSRRVSPMAGFQVTIMGRFWVTTEANRPSIRIMPGQSCGALGGSREHHDCADAG
jgi:hypothetical protein